MRINLHPGTNLPATLAEYVNVAKLNARNADWWGECENGWAHGPSNRPIATYLVADDYYSTYGDALRDGVAYGIKMCKNCVRYCSANHGEQYILAARPIVSLHKRHTCGAEMLNGRGEAYKLCTRAGSHYILFNGKRIWKCANHITPYLKAGFETFYISGWGKVVCSTERLWDIFGLDD